MKGKRFGALFSRLPSLAALDQLNQRLVRARLRGLHGGAAHRVGHGQGGLEERLAVGPAAGQLASSSGSSTRPWCSSATPAGTGGASRCSPSSASALVVGSMITLNVLPDRASPATPATTRGPASEPAAAISTWSGSRTRAPRSPSGRRSRWPATTSRRRWPAWPARPGVGEVMVVSTCNRVECYVYGEALEEARHFFLVPHRGGRGAPLRAQRPGGGSPPLPRGREPRLHGGGRAADPRAGEGGLRPGRPRPRPPATFVSRLCNRAFATAKRVRSETEIARGAGSVSQVAVELVEKIFGNLKEQGGAAGGRGQDGRALGQGAPRAGRRPHPGHQPLPGAGRGAGRRDWRRSPSPGMRSRACSCSPTW